MYYYCVNDCFAAVKVAEPYTKQFFFCKKPLRGKLLTNAVNI